jgi:YfiH family protein
VSAAGLFQGPPAADGVVADGAPEGTPIPAVRTADCVAILLADSEGRVLGALHGGWRGLAAGIASRAVSRFAAAGARREDLVVALGPAILSCCYEVGAAVVDALGQTCGPTAGYVRQSRSGLMSVDLHAAAAAQLAAAGVPPAAIHAAPYCTRCRNDLFFSFRAEGTHAGRQMAGIGPAASP